jgi:neopullulanase
VQRRIVALAVTALCAACSSAPDAESGGPPARSCTLTIWHRASSPRAHVEIVSSFRDWKRPGDVLSADRDDGWRSVSYELAPGEHAYGIVEDGIWVADPNVPTSSFHEGHEVARVEIPSCGVPAVAIDEAHGSADGSAKVLASFLASQGGPGLDPASFRVTDRDGSPVAADIVASDPAHGTAELAVHGLAPGKHALVVGARDGSGKEAEPARATVWIEPRPIGLEDLVVYQVVVDRFRGDAGPLAPPGLASARAGGTIAGTRRAIESGEIQALGANAIWLSPLYTNPKGMFAGKDGRLYSSYHGYWPIEPRAIEPLQGDEAEVDRLVRAAHDRGLRVIFDVVPNHVHAEHPYARAHAGDAAWFHHAEATSSSAPVSSSCVCGTPGCDWATHMEDCWFAPYLPDLEWKTDEVAKTVTSDVLWWLDRFDGDGLRIDAVPMMPRAASRRIGAAVRGRYDHAGNRTLVLGENFTGPGGYDLLKYALGPFGLDSEFHFPLMWALRRAVAEGSAPMTDVDAAVRAGEDAWRGSGAVMGLMIGNHDVARFASVSAGDGDGDGWTPAAQSPDPRVYEKQALALGLVFTLPGAPVLYYGDEVGLAGKQDPDARRVMPADADLAPEQKTLRTKVAAYGKARGCVEALRRGTYRALFADAEHLVFAREIAGSPSTADRQAAGSTAIVVVARQPVTALEATLPGIEPGTWVDVLGGTEASLRPELTKFDVAPFSVRVYVPRASACAPAR